MKAIFQYLLQFYLLRWPFPHKGYKYFEQLMQWLQLMEKPFLKKMPEGFQMYLSLQDHIEKQLFWYGSYEQREMEVLLQCIEPESIVVDAGANIGYVSLLAASVAVNGRVWAIEPGQKALVLLKRNLAINPALPIDVLSIALGNDEKSCIYYPSSSDNRGMSGLTPAENHNGEEELVAMTTLDKVSNELQIYRIDVVKLDIEGAELLALQGMKHILKNNRPWLFVEIAKSNLARFAQEPQELLDYLTLYNYEAFQIVGKRLLKKSSFLPESSLILFKPLEKAFPESLKVVVD